MNRDETIRLLRGRCDELSRLVTAMHPDVGRLGHPSAQAEILRALFELTKQVEVVKKHLIRLEKQDGSTLV